MLRVLPFFLPSKALRRILSLLELLVNLKALVRRPRKIRTWTSIIALIISMTHCCSAAVVMRGKLPSSLCDSCMPQSTFIRFASRVFHCGAFNQWEISNALRALIGYLWVSIFSDWCKHQPVLIYLLAVQLFIRPVTDFR